MRLSSEQISCRLMNICYLRSLFGYPNSMILYLLSEQKRPSAIRELGYNLEFPPSLITLARTVVLNDYKLKQGFQQVFNTTVFGYLQQQRFLYNTFVKIRAYKNFGKNGKITHTQAFS